MLSFVFMTLMASAEWTEPQRKNFYFFCLSTVAEYKDGTMVDPLKADGYCRCLTDILQLFVENPTNENIIQFAESPQAKIVGRCPGATEQKVHSHF